MSVLLIELENIRSGSFSTSGSFKTAELDIEGLAEYNFVESAKLALRVSTTDKLTFYVSGSLNYLVKGECRRCLKDLQQDKDCEIRGIFAFPEALQKLIPSEEERESEDIFPLSQNQKMIDLKGLVRETLVLDYPRFLLCSEDCKGLCPECGADLNENNCNCRDTILDQRWTKLRELSK